MITATAQTVNPTLIATIVETVLAKMTQDAASSLIDATPRGQLGTCQGCGLPVPTHFDKGSWIGCLKGSDDTVYTLVPHTLKPRKANGHVLPETGEASALSQAPAPSGVESTNGAPRGFTRARYHSGLHHRAKVGKLDLSPTRAKVLQAIHATGRNGILAKQIIKRAGLPHGSVQQTLNWLRAHDLVRAQEDAA